MLGVFKLLASYDLIEFAFSHGNSPIQPNCLDVTTIDQALQ